EGMVFADTHEVNRALATGQVAIHARVKVRVHQTVINENGEREQQTIIVDTTPGRCLLWEVVPEGLSFDMINLEMTKKNISKLINSCYRKLGLKDTVIFADQLMYLGFRQATRSGVSVGMEDMLIPPTKHTIIDKAETEVREIEQQFEQGFVTAGERYNKVVDIWARTNDQVAKAMMDNLSYTLVKNKQGEDEKQKSFNSIYMMSDSGARGSAAQIRQ
ncbi:DNA-directed RNA polymerase subunit beta', partial [Acinetobacter baumannii]|nr:DNA-directed RNA polymerase subunit beta' [Acinetobacter baumannii]